MTSAAQLELATARCTRCGKPAIPGNYRPWRHAALADAVACTVPGGPMTAAPATVTADACADPERFAQASLFDAEAI